MVLQCKEMFSVYNKIKFEIKLTEKTANLLFSPAMVHTTGNNYWNMDRERIGK